MATKNMDTVEDDLPDTEDFKKLHTGAVEELEASNMVHKIFKDDNNATRHNARDCGPAASAGVLLANPHRPGRSRLRTPKEDTNLMKRALERMNFAIASKELALGTERNSVRRMIEQLCCLGLERHQCFLFYYSGCADESGIVLPDGHVIEYASVIKSACKCESLSGKPKLFIFDCSRAAVPRRDSRAKTLTKESLPPDCLLVFSTLHLGVALGDQEKGSFFTYNLETSLQFHYSSLQAEEVIDLMDILDEVCRDVEECVPRRTNGKYTQSPQVLSTLRPGVRLEVSRKGLLCKETEDITVSEEKGSWTSSCQIL